VDLNIPQVSGYELIEKLTKDRRTKSIPVIVISALPEDNLVDEVLNAGAQLFLEKPVALVDLLSVIQKFEAESSL
jgi:response regulator RpfG family c-di-GMP phosphodiesterase